MTFIFLFGFVGVYGKMLVLQGAGSALYPLGQHVKLAVAANANSVTAVCIGAVGSAALAITSLIAVADTISTMDRYVTRVPTTFRSSDSAVTNPRAPAV